MKQTGNFLFCFLLLSVSLFSQSGSLQSPGAGQDESTTQGRAQNRRGNRGPCGTWGPGIQEADLVELSGVVTGVDMGSRRGNPTIEIDDKKILAGPYQLWLDSNFELSVNDFVKVKAFPSPIYPDALVAVKVKKADGSELLLRDETGRPLSRRGRGRQRGRF